MRVLQQAMAKKGHERVVTATSRMAERGLQTNAEAVKGSIRNRNEVGH